MLTALVLLPLLSLVLSFQRSAVNLTSDVLLFLLGVVAVALVGGIWPALVAAVLGSLLLNFFFVPRTTASRSRRATTSWR